MSYIAGRVLFIPVARAALAVAAIAGLAAAARAKAAEARSVADDAAHEAGGMKNDVTGAMRN